MISFSFDESTRTVRCGFPQKMDTLASMKAAEEFEHGMKDLTAAGGRPEGLKIVFDLKDVAYIASSFLRLCLIAAKKADSGGFSIVNTAPEIIKIFRISGLGGILNVS